MTMPKTMMNFDEKIAPWATLRALLKWNPSTRLTGVNERKTTEFMATFPFVHREVKHDLALLPYLQSVPALVTSQICDGRYIQAQYTKRSELARLDFRLQSPVSSGLRYLLESERNNLVADIETNTEWINHSNRDLLDLRDWETYWRGESLPATGLLKQLDLHSEPDSAYLHVQLNDVKLRMVAALTECKALQSSFKYQHKAWEDLSDIFSEVLELPITYAGGKAMQELSEQIACAIISKGSVLNACAQFGLGDEVSQALPAIYKAFYKAYPELERLGLLEARQVSSTPWGDAPIVRHTAPADVTKYWLETLTESLFKELLVTCCDAVAAVGGRLILPQNDELVFSIPADSVAECSAQLPARIYHALSKSWPAFETTALISVKAFEKVGE